MVEDLRKYDVAKHMKAQLIILKNILRFYVLARKVPCYNLLYDTTRPISGVS